MEELFVIEHCGTASGPARQGYVARPDAGVHHCLLMDGADYRLNPDLATFTTSDEAAAVMRDLERRMEGHYYRVRRVMPAKNGMIKAA